MRVDPLCSGRFVRERDMIRVDRLGAVLWLPYGDTAKSWLRGVAMACLCCENASRFENGDEREAGHSLEAARFVQTKVHQGFRPDWEGTRAVAVQAQELLALPADDTVPFFWGKFGYKSRLLSWRPDRVLSLSLDVVPPGCAHNGIRFS